MTLPNNLAPFVIDQPETPSRVFGGVDADRVMYLRFNSKDEQETEFEAAGIIAPLGFALPPDFQWPGIGDISIVGTIYNDDSVRGPDDENGMPTFSPPTARPGWHVNVLPS